MDEAKLITIEGIRGRFRTDHYCVVGTNMIGKRVVVKNDPCRPSDKTLDGYRQAWPRGITLYYCDDAGIVEYVCD